MTRKGNAALIFTVLNTIGVVATAVMAVAETKKGKGYVGTAVTAGATIASGIASYGVSAKAITGLTATAGYLVKNRDKMLDRVRDYVPEPETRKRISKEIAEDAWTPAVTVEETGNGDLLCFEGYSGRWFRSSFEAVKEGLADFNMRWHAGEYLSLNDLYDHLEIEKTHFGHQWGWPNNDDYYSGDIDIDACLAEDFIDKFGEEVNTPVLLIDIYTYPMEAWMEV